MSGTEFSGDGSWRQAANDVITAAQEAIPPFAAIAEKEISIEAYVNEFTERYTEELLPIHTAAWGKAVEVLGEYGSPMRYTLGGVPHRSLLSTGLLMTEEVQIAGIESVVPVTRLSISKNYAYRYDPTKLTKARDISRESKRTKAVAAALVELATIPEIVIEVGVATTSDCLFEGQSVTLQQEVAYPKNMRDPEFGATCWVKGISVFDNKDSTCSLTPPKVPVCNDEKARRYIDTKNIAILQTDLDFHDRRLQKYKTVADMLTDIKPLSTIPEFKKRTDS